MNQLLTRLLEEVDFATGPNRALDCRLHAALTGQISRCVNKDVAESEAKYGRMLIEKGGEVLWTSVPPYSENAEFVFRTFSKEHALKVTSQPAAIRAIARSFKGEEYMSKKWISSLWAPEKNESICIAGHDSTLALCLCGLGVKWKML